MIMPRIKLINFKCMNELLFNKPFTEHHNHPYGVDVSSINNETIIQFIPFLKKEGYNCFEIKNNFLHTSYYIGVDWLIKNKLAIYIEPKLNKNSTEQTDYLKMLFSALKHPEVVQHTKQLFDIKFDDVYIEIDQQKDLITPLLVVQYLRVLKEIVRKGLKKSYYKVEQNLNSRIKGKVLVSKTIKNNILKNRILKTYCSYDEFGYNGFENRLLKKALIFVKKYLPILDVFNANEFTSSMFNYINPAFESISDEVSMNEVKHNKKNVFYREYEEAIRLAKLILKRFGYNITNTKNKTVKTPPFWIDMSKLFELYVLGFLKDRFGNKVEYHIKDSGNELDFLLKTEDLKMVIDAKYKTKYQGGFNNDDIRQVSGYARLEEVYKKFNPDFKNCENKLIDCLIIYPDQDEGNDDLKTVKINENEIKQFVQFYKVAVKLPVLNKVL